MSRAPKFTDVVPRHQRTTQRNARREGVSERRNDNDHDDVHDSFIEQIRSQQVDHFDVHESPSAHSSPRTNVPSSSSAFAASSRVRRSPANNDAGLSTILASLQQIRRSPSSVPPLSHDVATRSVQVQHDDENEDETHDRFNAHERVGHLPAHDASSQLSSSAAHSSHRADVTNTAARAARYASSNVTPFDTSSSASPSPTPGGVRDEQRMKQHAIERELASMRLQLLDLQKSHQTKDDVIAQLINAQNAERKKREEQMNVMSSDSRSLIKNAARPPVVKTENDNEPPSLPMSRAPRSPLNRAFPSLSPSSSPSLVVGAQSRQRSLNEQPDAKSMKNNNIKTQDEDDDDEHKYDAPEEKKAKRIGDLPDAAPDDEIECSDDEADVIVREQRPDTVIKLKEPTNDNHIESYPEWALQREKMYSFVNYKQMYTSRHSLLSPLDRQNEWMRFGILTHFNHLLFGRTARQWFETYMQELNDPIIGAKLRKVRSVAKQILPIPIMYYDERDDYGANDDDCTAQDLQEGSFTFEKLPAPLRDMPQAHERAASHHHTLAQLVNTYVYHRRLKKAGQQQPTTPVNKSITQEMRDEEHPCARCNIPVYNQLKRMCTPCDDTVRQLKQAAIETGYRPPLESEDQAMQQRLGAGSTANTPAQTQKTTSIKNENAFSLMIGTYNDPSAASVPGVNNDNEPDSHVRVKTERAALTYREQEEELTLLHHRANDTVKASTSTTDDKDEERDSPLGDILSVVFQPYQRALQRRLRRDPFPNGREESAAATVAVTTIGKFDGSVAAAPMYLQQLCSQVQQNNFGERVVVSIMQRTMTGNALMWLNANMHEVFTIRYKPLQVLLHRFRQQYIGSHIIRDLRKQMASTTLTNDSLTMKDLDTHYAAYQGLVMRLSMSDRHVDEEETRTEFFTSLPRSVRTFIGSSFDKCTTVHDVYTMAQKSVMLNASRAGVKQDGDLPRTIGINALPAGTKPKSKYDDKQADKPADKSNKPAGKPPARSADKDKKTAQCYHCGARGHYTGDCQYGKDVQTLRGQEMWAQRNKDNGWTYPYDQQWWIDKSKQIAEARAANANKTQRNRDRSRSPKTRPDAVVVPDDESAADDDDE
jgi:hypothetical protein